MPANHLILCHPLLRLPSIFPSIRVFPNELALHIRWPKYWSYPYLNRSSSDSKNTNICCQFNIKKKMGMNYWYTQQHGRISKALNWVKTASQMGTYYKIPFMVFQKRQNYKNGELAPEFSARRRSWLQSWSIQKCWRVIECSASWLQWWLHNSVHIETFIELYTKNKSILLYVN